MIRTYGQGQATSITKRLDHHAEALLPLAGVLMNGLLAAVRASIAVAQNNQLGSRNARGIRSPTSS